MLELMLTLVLIGILTTLSLPIYSEHIQHERRLEAEIALENLALALEDYFTLQNSYQNATFDQLHVSEWASDQHYHLSMKVTPTDYELTATPDEAGDSACGTLTLNALGKKGINTANDIQNCW